MKQILPAAIGGVIAFILTIVFAGTALGSGLSEQLAKFESIPKYSVSRQDIYILFMEDMYRTIKKCRYAGRNPFRKQRIIRRYNELLNATSRGARYFISTNVQIKLGEYSILTNLFTKNRWSQRDAFGVEHIFGINVPNREDDIKKYGNLSPLKYSIIGVDRPSNGMRIVGMPIYASESLAEEMYDRIIVFRLEIIFRGAPTWSQRLRAMVKPTPSVCESGVILKVEAVKVSYRDSVGVLFIK